MRETGVVKGVRHGAVVVEVDPADERLCSACGMQQSCERGPAHALTIPYEGDIRVGQVVEVNMPMPSPVLGALIVFLVPVAGLLAGYGVGRALARVVSAAPETAIVVVATVLGLFLSVAAAILCERAWRRRHPASVRPVGENP